MEAFQVLLRPRRFIMAVTGRSRRPAVESLLGMENGPPFPTPASRPPGPPWHFSPQIYAPLPSSPSPTPPPTPLPCLLFPSLRNPCVLRPIVRASPPPPPPPPPPTPHTPLPLPLVVPHVEDPVRESGLACM